MPIKILHINDKCTGCGACVSTCTKEALSLQYDKEGFYYPVLNYDKCVNCKRCESVCHILCHKENKDIIRDYVPYMLKSKDKSIIRDSSSGGVFSLLAAKTLEKGGVVYGARYNYDLERLEHCNTDICNIEELRKSKYIESYMGNTFADVRNHLRTGREVLFCGTPCQVKGLLQYLEVRKTNTKNLLTVRFICHGVPANKFFTEYKHWKEKKVGSRITHLDFRPKTRGWRTSNILLKFENGKVIDELYQENYYYYYFQHNLSLRKCCYNCNLIEKSYSDYTIADFWGIYYYEPENKDQEGISLLLAHSKKAKELVKCLDCEIKVLPQTAVEYIYKDSSFKKKSYDIRNLKMTGIIKNGYINQAQKELRREIFIFKLKTKTLLILNKIGLWKILKK